MDIPETIKQLDQWMKNNCYRNDSYAIAGRRIYEGYGLEKRSNKYIWYYTERGQEQVLEKFDTEAEAVAYAFNQIKSDKFADRHMIAFVSNKLNLSPLYNELDKRGVNYFTDELFYAENDYRTRVFVFGCDIKKVADLKNRYYNINKIKVRGIYILLLLITSWLLGGIGYGGTGSYMLNEICFYSGIIGFFASFILFLFYVNR